MNKKFLPFLPVILFLMLSSCASTAVEKIDDKVFYKNDMFITVNGIQREGVLVAPRAAYYNISVDARGNLDLFTLATCHRELQREKAGDSSLFGDKRHLDLVYSPVPEMETTGACPVQLGGYERGAGRHSWAMIDFEEPAMQLPATMQCNGETWQSRGVTMCQSKAELYQRIIFSKEVVVNPEPNCPMPVPADRKTFKFPIPHKKCVFRFTEIDGGREHRLTTVGYDEILIRGN